jgi:hypothetical protein
VAVYIYNLDVSGSKIYRVTVTANGVSIYYAPFFNIIEIWFDFLWNPQSNISLESGYHERTFLVFFRSSRNNLLAIVEKDKGKEYVT